MVNKLSISEAAKCLYEVFKDEGVDLDFFKHKEKYVETWKNAFLSEDVRFAFLLPSDVNIFKKHKKEICQIFNKNVCGMRRDAFEIISSKKDSNKSEAAISLALLETIFTLRYDSSDALIKDVRDYWVPLADKYGMWKLRYILEDNRFEILDPEGYGLMCSVLKSKTKFYAKLFKDIDVILSHYLNEAGLKNYKILHRQKNVFGLYQKMKIKGKSINHITDLFAFRILVSKKQDCYKVLDVLHNLWPHYETRLKDYVAVSKLNGYRSIHTTLKCLNGENVEFQIRTMKMDHIAKYGHASYLMYKEENRKKVQG